MLLFFLFSFFFLALVAAVAAVAAVASVGAGVRVGKRVTGAVMGATFTCWSW